MVIISSVYFVLLYRVIDNSKENRMQVHNIAIVFGPTLIWPEKETPNLAANMIYQSRIVEFLLLEFKHIFKSWSVTNPNVGHASCVLNLQKRLKNKNTPKDMIEQRIIGRKNSGFNEVVSLWWCWLLFYYSWSVMFCYTVLI